MAGNRRKSDTMVAFNVSPPFGIYTDSPRMLHGCESLNEQVPFQRCLDKYEATLAFGTENARNSSSSHDGDSVDFFRRG
jgi:hypothetical protein